MPPLDLARDDSFQGRRAVVMGLGRFGGGLGVTRWLAARGCDVLLTDIDPAEKLAEPLAHLKPLIDAGRIELRLGGHNVSDFTTADLVIANPAVPHPWDNRFLRAAQAASVPITTEIGLAVARLRSRDRTIAVTGTAGKSTTSALIHHILLSARLPALLAGNIGGSLLESLASINEHTWLVLELSSFQLHWIHQQFAAASRASGWSPRIAVVTTIAPNHLDWHGTMDHYITSKQVLLRHQRPGDTAILGDSVLDWPSPQGVRRIHVPANARVGPMRLPGAHNQVNAAMAAQAVAALDLPGLDAAAAATAACTYAGLPHRLQFVAAIPRPPGEIRCYNDSKSTTPDATLLAVNALADTRAHRKHIHLIAGGYDKGSDLAPIAALAPELAGLYTIGATGPALAAAANGAVDCHTLAAAIDTIAARAQPGDVVLLSPGCASWDQYANYEQRGEDFAARIRAWATTAAGPTA